MAKRKITPQQARDALTNLKVYECLERIFGSEKKFDLQKLTQFERDELLLLIEKMIVKDAG